MRDASQLERLQTFISFEDWRKFWRDEASKTVSMYLLAVLSSSLHRERKRIVEENLSTQKEENKEGRKTQDIALRRAFIGNR